MWPYFSKTPPGFLNIIAITSGREAGDGGHAHTARFLTEDDDLKCQYLFVIPRGP
jgi:hypothetical protein